MNTGRFPGYQALNDEKDLDEERRLLYVAVTRAKRNLYLMKPEELTTRGQGWQVGELSPLLADLRDLPRLVAEKSWSVDAGGDLPETGEAPADDREQLQRIQDYFSGG